MNTYAQFFFLLATGWSVACLTNEGMAQQADGDKQPSRNGPTDPSVDDNKLWMSVEANLCDPLAVSPYSVGPIVFLERLTMKAKTETRLPPVYPAPDGWISAQDAIELFRHVNSKEACLAAHNTLASIIGPSNTTVGVEARRMIYGYISGGYPPVSPSGLEVRLLKDQLLKRISDQLDANTKQVEKKPLR